MTLNGAIMQLVEMRENSMMPMVFKPYFDKVIETISECEEPHSQPQWIPCNEITGKGFPKEDGNYYITEQNYGYYLESDEKQCVAHMSPFRKGDFTNRFYDANHSNIVAWMPLPEPWKGEEE